MSSNSKSFEDWTHEELKEWIQSIKQIPPKPKEAILQKINQYNTDGSVLASCSSSENVVEMLELENVAHGSVLWNQISKVIQSQPEGKPVAPKSTPKSTPKSNEDEEKKHKQNENVQKVMSLFNPPPSSSSNLDNSKNNNNSKNKNDKENIEFRPTIFMNGKSSVRSWTINSSWTVSRLQEEIQNRETGVKSDSLTKDKFVSMDLTCNNKPMSSPNKQLYEYGLVGPYNIIVVVSRLRGGAQLSDNEERIRRIDINNPLITITTNADSITYEDSYDDPRALMPCGHAFTAITMYIYIRHSFKDDLEITQFWCPVPNCSYKEPWEWSLMACVADLSMDEFETYSNLITQHELLKNEIKLCPHCKTLVSKPEQISQTRVACTNCNKSDFCYCCLKLWVGGGLQICGNEDCETNLITTTLENCENVKLKHGDMIEIPAIRACPNCLTLVRHVENCKHMKCPRKECGIEFCFSCLRKKDATKGWECSGAYSKCVVAGRQKLK